MGKRNKNTQFGEEKETTELDVTAKACCMREAAIVRLTLLRRGRAGIVGRLLPQGKTPPS